MDSPNPEKSVFNEGIHQIWRLNNDWSLCKIYRENGLLGKLRFKLDSIQLELCVDIERLHKQEEVDKINEELARVHSDVLSNKDLAKNRLELYKLLNKKEAFLRKVQDLAGKGGKRSNPEEEEGLEG